MLTDLVRRMVTKDVRTSSNQSISWHAHREAEGLSDPGLIPELQALLETSKSNDERKSAYFILGALGANTSDRRCARVVGEQLGKEKDKYVLMTGLEALEKIEKPRDFPLEDVFVYLSDKRWLVRHAAIRALRKTDTPEVEERLLNHLSSTEDAHDRIYCHSTLGSVGSARSLPALEASLRSRNLDVKASAETAIRSINTRIAAVGPTHSA